MSIFPRTLAFLAISMILTIGISAAPTSEWLGDHSDIAHSDRTSKLYTLFVNEAQKAEKGFLGDVTLGEDISAMLGAPGYGIKITELTGTTTFAYTGDSASDSNEAYTAIMSQIQPTLEPLISEVCSVYSEFLADHPQYFWLSGNAESSYTLQYSYGSDGTANYTASVYFLLLATDANGASYDIRCEKYRSPAVIAADFVKQEQAITAILALPEVVSAKTDVEKLHALNDALTSRNSYYAGSNPDDAPHEAHHGLAALVGASGYLGPVCEGYACAFKILCDRIDIPCITVNGYSINNVGDSGAHMWNAVYIDSNWYAIDVTWDDPASDADKTTALSGCECDDYFLVGDDTVINGVSFHDSHHADVEHPLTGLGIKLCSTSYGLTGGKDDSTPLSSMPFTDVAVNDKYAADIAYVFKEGLMNGVSATNFAPKAELTRSMLVTILWRYGGSPKPSAPNSFNDVPSDQWFTDAVIWAASNGIVTGYGDGRFAPNDSVTLEQALIILARYADGIGIKTSASPDISAYKHSTWAASGVSFGAANGIIDEACDLTAKATRAEIAAYLHRFSALEAK